MESKEGVEALFLFATEGIIIVNNRGEITRVNPSIERLFGYSKEELIGNKIEILVPTRFSGNHSHYRETYNNNLRPRSMGAETDLFALRKDGTEFPVEISLSPYSNQFGSFVIAFVVDITLRKQTEEKHKTYSADLERQVKNRTLILEEAILELEKTKKELYKSLDKERELNELKTRFVSMASHEFRTPLTTMMSSLSLVERYCEQKDAENQNKHMLKIKKSINNLTDILNDFLSVSKLEEGKIGNSPNPINLELFLEDVVNEMQGMIRDKQQFITRYEGNQQVNLDQKLLKNVLFNLISNAIKFSRDDGEIELISQVFDSSIEITIKDSGIGIAKADQKHLFERFFRAQNATNIQGTGLGLNIVARYVELMNGRISFESKENAGTTFTLIFPKTELTDE